MAKQRTLQATGAGQPNLEPARHLAPAPAGRGMPYLWIADAGLLVTPFVRRVGGRLTPEQRRAAGDIFAKMMGRPPVNLWINCDGTMRAVGCVEAAWIAQHVAHYLTLPVRSAA